MKKLLALFTLFLGLSLFCGNAQAQERKTVNVGKIGCGDTFTLSFDRSTYLGTSITLKYQGHNGNTATFCLKEAMVTDPGTTQPIGEVATTTTYYTIVGEVTRDGFCSCER
ncbi:MAG: hypothetical protein E6772_01360 [Dysgonomonas sp.]|nr:hypothetical protein [Dysgonomonas sp.]